MSRAEAHSFIEVGSRRSAAKPMPHALSLPVYVDADRRGRKAVRGGCGGLKRWVGRAAFYLGVLSMFLPSVTVAEDLALPADVEAKLSASVAAYDRTLAARAGERVVIAIVTNASDADSSRAAAQLQGAFREVDTIARLPHAELILPWKDAASLTAACAARQVSIVFLSTGLNHAVEPIVKALEGTRILTIAGSLPYVTKGVVLGFDLVSGRPKVVINLAMARKQGLDFRAELLRLARVVE